MVDKYPKREHPWMVELGKDIAEDQIEVVRKDPVGYVAGFLGHFTKTFLKIAFIVWLIFFILLMLTGS